MVTSCLTTTLGARLSRSRAERPRAKQALLGGILLAGIVRWSSASVTPMVTVWPTAENLSARPAHGPPGTRPGWWSSVHDASLALSVVFAGGGTGLGGPVDPRRPVRPAFIPEPSRAGCGCLILTVLVVAVVLLVLAGQG